MFPNPFINKNTDYKRDYNIVKKYVNDTAFYVHKMKNIPIDEAKDKIKSLIKSDKVSINNPKILMLEREDNLDKIQKEYNFLDYIKDVQDSNSILSPSLTTYVHPDVKESVSGMYLGSKMAQRKEVKKRGHVAEMEKDFVLASYCYNLQTAIKIIVNSVSGAHGSVGTPLYNHSAHPTLTSTCRCATSYANANNERYLEGMRHYWSYETAQSDIISIVANSDYKKIQSTMDEFNLSHPSGELVISTLKRSCYQYWRDEKKFEKLVELINTLTPIERSAYLFTQDLYSLFIANEDFVKAMIKEFAHCPNDLVDDPDYWVSQLDQDMLMSVSIIAGDYLNGRTLNKVKDTDQINYKKFGSVIKNFIVVREKYKNLISTFWKTDHMPTSVGLYPAAIRKCVIVSDTDSTIFTVADWVSRVDGNISFGSVGKSIATVMVYFSSQTLKHVLAKYSAYMGVIPERIFQLTMKNEFMMESLMLTSKSKHYAYRVIAKEGNVYSTAALDIKGVSLRNSKVPDSIRAALKKMIDDILEDIKVKGKVSILEYLHRVGDLEYEILNKIKSGSSGYLTRHKIRDKDAYRKPMSTAYYYYEFWQNTFGKKYGMINELPSTAVKVSFNFSNQTQFKKWLDKLDDVDLAKDIKDFLAKTNRKYLKFMLVPLDVAINKGIADEILSGTDIRQVVYSSTEGFYLLLESLGYYCQNDTNSRLIYDNYGKHKLQKNVTAH